MGGEAELFDDLVSVQAGDRKVVAQSASRPDGVADEEWRKEGETFAISSADVKFGSLAGVEIDDLGTTRHLIGHRCPRSIYEHDRSWINAMAWFDQRVCLEVEDVHVSSVEGCQESVVSKLGLHEGADGARVFNAP